MGGSKTTSTQKTKIPAEIRHRGTTITNAAMGGYFNPTGRYTPYQYGGQATGYNNPNQGYSTFNTRNDIGGQTGGIQQYQPLNQGATWTETTGGQQQPSNGGYNNWIAGGGNTGGTQTTPSYAGQQATSYNEHGDPIYSYAPQQTQPQVTATGTGGYISNKGVVSPNTGTPTGIPGVNLLTMNKKGEGTYSYDPGPDYGFGGMNAGQHDWSSVGEALTGDLNQYHANAGQQVMDAGSNYQPYYDAATGLAMGAQGYQAGYGTNDPNVQSGMSVPAYQGNNYYGADTNAVQGPNFSYQNLQQFFNPFQQGVIDQGVRNIGDAMTQRRLADQSRAGIAGAFGGTRHAVLDNLNATSAMQSLNDFVGQQLNTGYDKAVNQFNTNYDQQLRSAGQNFNQGLQQAQFNNDTGQQGYQNRLQQAGFDNQAAQQNYQNYMDQIAANNAASAQNFGQTMQGATFAQGMGTAQQDAALKAAKASTDLGNIYTARDEAAKQNAYNYGYKDARDYPLEVYERLAGINAMQPVNRTSTTTTSQSGGWLGPLIGAAGSIMASDERLKENVDDLDPEAVLGAFSKVAPKTYTYKDEAREAFPEATAPGQRRGFMAQDYEKAFKRKNVDMGGGYQGMDVANVLGDLVAAVHGLEARTRRFKKKAH